VEHWLFLTWGYNEPPYNQAYTTPNPATPIVSASAENHSYCFQMDLVIDFAKFEIDRYHRVLKLPPEIGLRYGWRCWYEMSSSGPQGRLNLATVDI
jgi:hypothetical protein